MGTTPLGILGTLAYPFCDFVFEIYSHGWSGMREHWEVRRKTYIGIAFFWWATVFTYHLVYAVPIQIRGQAERGRLEPKVISLFARPLLPQGWDKYTQIAQPSSFREGRNVTLEIGSSTDPHYAFETRFVLTNHNPLSMTDASYTCEIQNIDVNGVLALNRPVAMNFGATGPIEDLPAGKSRSLYCDFVGAGFVVERMDTPVVQIWVAYTYKSNKNNEGFRFFAKRKYDDKTFVWFPGGAAQESLPTAKKP